MTGIDADEIIRLRDSKSFSWNHISRHMGYHPNTCKKHYTLRKDGKMYSNDEFVKILNNVETVDLTVKQITQIICDNGLILKPSYVVRLLTAHGIPFKWSNSIMKPIIKEALELHRNLHFAPYDALRCVHMGSEASFRYLLTVLEKEIINAYK